MVNLEQLRHIASLSNLDYTDEELLKFSGDFNRIVEYIGLLDEIDTSNIEPLAYPVPHSGKLRDDILLPCVCNEYALKNAPATDGLFFTVPKVIG